MLLGKAREQLKYWKMIALLFLLDETVY